MIQFYAHKRSAVCDSDDRLTTGSVGVEVVFHFSDDWESAPSRIAVFRGSGVSVDVALLEDSCTVPPEVLTQPGSTLTIGVYGTDGAGTVVIPTVYAEAGQIRRGAEPSGIEPTPTTQPLIDQLLAAAQAARDAADEAERLAQSVRDAAEAGEFDGEDGADGNGVWYVDVQYTRTTGAGVQAQLDHMVGRSGATPAARDLCVVSDGRFGSITIITPRVAVVPVLGDLSGKSAYELAVEHGYTGTETEWLDDLQGADGFAPEVTIETITGGTRITITSAAHPDGQSFDVMDGQGGSGTVDDDFSTTSENPVQNKVITGALNTARQQLQILGLALDNKVDKITGKGLSSNDFTDSDKAKLDDAASETWVTQQGYLTSSALDDYRTAEDQNTIDQQQNTAIAAKYAKPSGGIPASDLAAGVIPTVPSNVSSFANDAGYLTQHQDISGKLDKAQGVAHAGEFVVVGSDGNITTVSMTAWQGGSY